MGPLFSECSHEAQNILHPIVGGPFAPRKILLCGCGFGRVKVCPISTPHQVLESLPIPCGLKYMIQLFANQLTTFTLSLLDSQWVYQSSAKF